MRAHTLIATLAIASVTVHEVSNWWEKAWATPDGGVLSPDGCLRLVPFTPYWILPSIFHEQPIGNGSTSWGAIWEAPAFYRLYVEETGMFLGETPTFDAGVYSEIFWGLHQGDRTRKVSVGGYTLANTTQCTDPQSRQKMDFYHSKVAARIRELSERKP